MQPVLFVAANVAIAAAIGGLTNFVAIRMLFYPRKAWHVLGRRVPFTPGLIPKRREELAVSLGQVVARYLVTPEGLRRTLLSPAFAGKLTARLGEWLDRLAAREGTVGEWAAERWGAEKVEAWEQNLQGWLEAVLAREVRRLWHGPGRGGAGGWKDRTVGDIFRAFAPDVMAKERWLDRAAERAADAVLGALEEELASDRGGRLVRRIVSRLLGEGAGVLGTIAGWIVREERVSDRLRRWCLEALRSEDARVAVREIVRARMGDWERLTLGDLVAAAGADGFGFPEEPALRLLARWSPGRRLLGLRWGDLLDERMLAWIRARLPMLVERGLELAGKEMDRLVAAFNLPELVRRQVSAFPAERVERIVLGVSGREFRAITWLGALLGGMIGLAQSLALIFLYGLS